MNNWADFCQALLWSFSPIGEIKVGLVYALYKGVPWFFAFLGCFLANWSVSFWFIYLLRRFHTPMLVHKWYSNMMLFFANKSKLIFKKDHHWYWTLFLFVAVPLPGTGVYSATIMAHILQLQVRSAILAIGLGVLASGLLIIGVVELGKYGFILITR